MRKFAILLALICISAFAFAMLGGLLSGISQLCSGITGVLPVVSMLMIVFAAVVYAAGQIMGAETRARANVWATTCLTGALLGVLIVSVAPALLTQLYGPSISCSGGGAAGCLGAGGDCSAPGATCCSGATCSGGTCFSTTPAGCSQGGGLCPPFNPTGTCCFPATCQSGSCEY
jgi:hypothetical protein